MPPETGDWVISDLTIVRDTYVMVNGSIIVESSGALVIINSALVMNLSYDGEHAIFVYGNFTVRNSSIYSLSPYINYYVNAYKEAKLLIENSYITHAGYDMSHPRIRIETNNATIRNTTIAYGYDGLYLKHTNGVVIYNNTFYQQEESGIETWSASNGEIANNAFCSILNYTIYLLKSNNNTIYNNNIDGVSSK